MKKLLFLPIALLILGACKPIDPVQEYNEYSNCVIYAEDTISGIGVATDYARINVSADMSTNLFSLEFTDVKLAPEASLNNFTVSGLQQYLQDVKDEQGNTTDLLYTFFNTQGAAYTDGLPVRNFRFGWLSTVYWCHFASDRTRVWSLPNDVQTYANKNTVTDAHGDTHYENAIRPRYDIYFNTSDNTVTVSATGVTLPSTTQAEKVFKFRDYKWEKLAVQYDKNGFRVNSCDFSPLTDGVRDRFKITDFSLHFDADYGGTHEARYYITEVADPENKIYVVTTLGYNRDQN